MKSRIAIATSVLLSCFLFFVFGCVQEDNSADKGDKEESEETPVESVAAPAPENACVLACREICGADSATDLATLKGYFYEQFKAEQPKEGANVADRRAAAAAKRAAAGKARPTPAGRLVNAAPNPLKNLPMKGAKDPKVVIVESSDFQ